jgi:hypothetical protein
MARERGTGSAKDGDVTGGGAAGGGQPHRWAIDRIEEGTAAVEQDGDHVYEIPRYLLPPDARDGDVVMVTITRAAAGEVTLSVRTDRAASAPPPSAKRAARKRRAGNDPGGDIVL